MAFISLEPNGSCISKPHEFFVENLDKLSPEIGSMVREIITKINCFKEESGVTKRGSLLKNVTSFVSSYLSKIDGAEQQDQRDAIERIAKKTLKRFMKGMDQRTIYPWYDDASSFPISILDNPVILARCSLTRDMRIRVLQKWGEELKKHFKLLKWPRNIMGADEFIKKQRASFSTKEIYSFPAEAGIPLISMEKRYGACKINIQGAEFYVDEQYFDNVRLFLSCFLNGDEIKPVSLSYPREGYDQSFWADDWRSSGERREVYNHIDRRICEYLSQLIASGQLSTTSINECILELFGGKGELANKILDLYPEMQYIFSDYDPASLRQAQERLSGKGVQFTVPTNAITADYQKILDGKKPSVIIISGGLAGCVLNNKNEAMTVLKKIYPFMGDKSKIILTGLSTPWISDEDLKVIGFRCLNLSHGSAKTVLQDRATWFYVAEVSLEKDPTSLITDNSLDLYYFFHVNKGENRVEKLLANFSLLQLEKVESLDLSFTDLSSAHFKKLLSVLPNLKRLNISGTNLLCAIPDEILSRLESLSICYNSYDYSTLRSVVEKSESMTSIKIDYSEKLSPQEIVEINMRCEMRKAMMSFDFLESNLYDKKIYVPLVIEFLREHSSEIRAYIIKVNWIEELTKENFMAVFNAVDLRKTAIMDGSEQLQAIFDFISKRSIYLNYEQEKPYYPSVEELKEILEEKYSDVLQGRQLVIREYDDCKSLIFDLPE